MTAPVLTAEEKAARAAVIAHLRFSGYHGKGFDRITRDAFDELAEQAFLRAEAECRGELLNLDGRRADIDPRSLFRGQWVRAQKYASEELLTHWQHPDTPRITYDDYVADLIRGALDETGANDHGEDQGDDDVTRGGFGVPESHPDAPEPTRTVHSPAPTRPEPVAEPRAAVPPRAAAPDPTPVVAPVIPATRGAALLDEARAFASQFVIWPSAAYLDLATLWAGLTHFRDANGDLCGQTNPHVFVTSEDYGGGKSTAFLMIALLSYNATIEVSPTGPGAVRQLSETSSTYFVDEWDVMCGAGSGPPLFRSCLTASFNRRTARTSTARGPRSIWTPIGLCGRGNRIMVNDELRAVLQRSHIIPMREKRDDEHVADFDEDRDPERAARIGAALTEWGSRVGPDASRTRPEMPAGVSNRRVDLWRPILRVADAAGGHWPKTARDACRAVCLSENDSTDVANLSAAEQTLVDVSYVFGLSGASDTHDVALTTRTILELLEERPGGSRWRQYPRDANGNSTAAAMQLASDLSTFGVDRGSGKVMTEDGRQVQGYKWSGIAPHIPCDLPVFTPPDESTGYGADADVFSLPFE
jgi:hypothetical protein